MDQTNTIEEAKVSRRERRRRKTEVKMEGTEQVVGEIQKTMSNIEFSIKPHVAHSLGKLVRRDTYTVLHSKSEKDLKTGDVVKRDNVSEEDSSRDSIESKNLTYSLEKHSNESDHATYNVSNTPDEGFRPVPAPRKWKSTNFKTENVSSDTDKDVTEIDLDILRVKSPKSDVETRLSNFEKSQKTNSESSKSDLIVAPIPKPRKNIKTSVNDDQSIGNSKCDTIKFEKNDKNSEVEHTKEINQKTSAKDDETDSKSNELPLLSNLQTEAKSDETQQGSKRRKKISISDLLDRKGKLKKSKKLSSLMKLEKKKIPKIASVLKDIKEEEMKTVKAEVEEEKLDFQVDSPRFIASAQNGQIYVQSKNGFRVVERDEVLGSRKVEEESGNGGMLKDSTVKTAILFQKYWSRFMIYFHGVLAGFGFSHAATVTAIMLHFNYDPQGFIGVYSCLSLKIHYAFYTLTALCIISCFDRIDVGHMNRRHWKRAWKVPSLWIILSIYLVSFVLTFSNQLIEARFDAHPYSNLTELWNTEFQSDIQVSLLQWYHSIWGRDMLVLFAWLFISLTRFNDFLGSHITNMAKYAEIKSEDSSSNQTSGSKGDYL